MIIAKYVNGAINYVEASKEEEDILLLKPQSYHPTLEEKVNALIAYFGLAGSLNEDGVFEFTKND